MSTDYKSASRKILLVDDDSEFLTYFLSLAEPYNLIFTICESIKSGQREIESTIYDAYIIDLNLPDGQGLDLIHEIRETKLLESPIAAISGFFCDEKIFKLLKEKYHVEYVLDKPVYPQQIDELLVNLFHPKLEEHSYNKYPEMLDLKEKYGKSISDKLVQLTELVQNVKDNPDVAHLTELKKSVHKIAGSAGSYGFPEVSRLCKALEYRLDQQLSSQNTIEKDWLDSLDEFLRKIKFNFQFPTLSKPEDSPLELQDSILRPSLYVVDGDSKFLELLQREKVDFDIDLLVEPNPEKAIAHLKSTEFNPRIVIASQTFFGSNITAFDLFETIKKKSGVFSTLLAIILDKDNIDNRIEAIQKGAKYIFHKPISTHMLLKAMTEALETELLRNFKVLILDDDVDVCRFVTSSLQEIGIQVEAIENPLQLYKALEEFSPNVLLLDVILPSYDGFNLLRTLRADILYQNLITVIVTVKHDDITELSSLSEQADGVLYKPLNKNILQKFILNLAKRRSSSMSIEQNRLGIDVLKTLMAKLHDILTFPKPFSYSLALCRIDNYSELVLQAGQEKVNDLMISISNALQNFENNNITCYFYNASTFAILFEGYDEVIIEKKIFDLLASIQTQSQLKFNFSASIVPISRDFGNSHRIIQAAENALKEAHAQADAPIKIVTHLFEGLPTYKHTLLLIEPNEDLQKILKSAFDTQGINVKTFGEGKEALQSLLNCKENELPALIISERKLPDMDGIEILKALNARFKTGTPFYFLTDFVAEKDVSEGLKYGALEYITKPFSLSLLIQRSLKTIFEKHH